MLTMKELSIEVTHDCALKCTFCSSSAEHPSPDGELPLSKIKEIIKDAASLGATIISISGGEPFLYKSLYDVLSFCQSLELEVLLYTSGVLFDDDHNYVSIDKPKWMQIKSIIEHVIVIFDLQSHKKEHVEAINSVVGSYELILDSIQSAIECGFICECHIVPMKINQDDLVQFVSFCKDIGLSKISFLRYVAQGRGETNVEQLLLSHEEFLQLQNQLHYIKSNYADYVRIGHPIDFLFTVDSKCKITHCRGGFDAPLVLPNGNVHVCPAWKCFDNYVAGNIFEESLIDIWNNSEYFTEFRKIVEESHLLNGLCNKCDYLNECKGGCTAQRIISFKKLGFPFPNIMYASPDPDCPLVHNFEILNDLRRKEE